MVLKLRWDRRHQTKRKFENAITDARCWVRNLSTNCALNFIQNTDIVIVLTNTVPKTIGLEWTIVYINNIKSRFPNYISYNNFVETQRKSKYFKVRTEDL